MIDTWRCTVIVTILLLYLKFSKKLKDGHLIKIISEDTRKREMHRSQISQPSYFQTPFTKKGKHQRNKQKNLKLNATLG